MDRILQNKEDGPRVLRLLNWMSYRSLLSMSTFYQKDDIGPVIPEELSIALGINEYPLDMEHLDRWALSAASLDRVVSCSEGMIVRREVVNTRPWTWEGLEYFEDRFTERIASRRDYTEYTFSHETVREYCSQGVQASTYARHVLENCINFFTSLNQGSYINTWYLYLQVDPFAQPLAKSNVWLSGSLDDKLYYFAKTAMGWGNLVETLYACAEDLPEEVSGLLSRLTSTPGSANIAPIHWCAANGWLKMCQFLLEQEHQSPTRKPTLEWSGDHSITPFALAARHGQLDAVKLLLNYMTPEERTFEISTLR